MTQYFVIDKQGTGWKEGMLWSSLKEIADSIRDYPDCEDDLAALPDDRLIEAWDFEAYEFTPDNLEQFGFTADDFSEDDL